MMNAAVHTQYQALASTAFHAHLLPSSNKLSSIRSLRPRLQRLLPIQSALNTTHRPNAVATTVVAPVERSSSSAVAGLTILPSTVDNRLRVIDFHHAEFWCADAASAAARFSCGLGVPLAARSDLSMGNTVHASHLLRPSSGSSLAFLFTAPYADAASSSSSSSSAVPSFSANAARAFTAAHGGLAVRAVAVRVADAAEAYRASVEAGARPAFSPADLGHGFLFAEVELYGDSVLRFVSYPDDTEVPFLPGFENVVPTTSSSEALVEDYGLTRFDHIVGNVPDLGSVVDYIAGFTGFHKFFEFTTEEVGTEESGLNGVVLSEGSDTVLLTVIEPAHGTKRRSQVQTYLDHHGGPGVQHLAMASDDLLATLRKIRARRASMGGFEFLPTPPPSYYDEVRRRIGDVLSEEQIKECEELGVMVDRGDDDGVVLQIFTKPVGDRPTLLLEFIQRIGCMGRDENGKQRGACGGFARGNTTDFIKAYEDYDKTLDAPAPIASS